MSILFFYVNTIFLFYHITSFTHIGELRHALLHFKTLKFFLRDGARRVSELFLVLLSNIVTEVAADVLHRGLFRGLGFLLSHYHQFIFYLFHDHEIFLNLA